MKLNFEMYFQCIFPKHVFHNCEFKIIIIMSNYVREVSTPTMENPNFFW